MSIHMPLPAVNRSVFQSLLSEAERERLIADLADEGLPLDVVAEINMVGDKARVRAYCVEGGHKHAASDHPGGPKGPRDEACSYDRDLEVAS